MGFIFLLLIAYGLYDKGYQNGCNDMRRLLKDKK
jgi:hypothetical protein